MPRPRPPTPQTLNAINVCGPLSRHDLMVLRKPLWRGSSRACLFRNAEHIACLLHTQAAEETQFDDLADRSSQAFKASSSATTSVALCALRDKFLVKTHLACARPWAYFRTIGNLAHHAEPQTAKRVDL